MILRENKTYLNAWFFYFSTEMRFAFAFENMLSTSYEDPVYKQISIEFFTVLCKIMKRHPEFSFIDTINVDTMINQAIKLYSEVCYFQS